MFPRFSRVVLCAFLSLFAFRAEAYLQELTPRSFNALYDLAAKGNVTAINNARSRGLNVDSVNSNGDTGLCVAAKNRDRRAFKSFLQSGANPYHPCTWDVGGYQDFMKSVIANPVKNLDTAYAANKGILSGMSLTTKALIGAGIVAAGAGTALALGGGGGGGGGAVTCINGHYEDGACVCNAGYEFYYRGNCYAPLACSNGGHQEASKCICPTAYNDGNLCENCGPGYGRNADGDCVPQELDLLGNPKTLQGAYINTNYNYTGYIDLNSTTYQNVYGLSYDAGDNYGIRGPSQSEFANAYAEYMFIDPEPEEGDPEPHHVIGNITNDININKQGDGNIYGMYSAAAETIYNNYMIIESGIVQGRSDSEINITSSGNGNVYGIYGNADIYNAHFLSFAEVGNTYFSDISLTAGVNVLSSGKGDVYGIYNGSDTKTIHNQNSVQTQEIETEEPYLIGYNGNICEAVDGVAACTLISSESSVVASNTGSGNAYGLYSLGSISNNTIVNTYSNSGNAYTFYAAKDVTNSGTTYASASSGTSYGMYAAGDGDYKNSGIMYSNSINGQAYGIHATAGGNVENSGRVAATTVTGNAYGIYADNAQIENSWGTAAGATTATTTTGDAYGIYNQGASSSVINNAAAKATTANGNAYGIYNVGGSVTNNADFINQSVYASNTGSSGISCGIFSDGGTVTHMGRIDVYGADGVTTYGIWAKNGAQVTIGGNFTIAINESSLTRDNVGSFCTASGCTTPIGGQAVYLEGLSTLTILGLMQSAAPLNVGLHGVTLGATGHLVSPLVEGNLSVSSSAVDQGFNQTYTLPDAIQTQDSSNLNLLSQSVMFNADLNGSDIVLTKKDFATVLENNASVASFLEQNYALQNNAALFNGLKQQTNLKALNNAVNKLTGQGVLSRFATEDMLMDKELSFDINDKMFTPQTGSFALTSTVTPQIFADKSTSGKYALSATDIGKIRVAAGLAVSEIHSYDAKRNNPRLSKNVQFIAPVRVRHNGFHFLISPKLAYAYGTYTRDGFNNKTYDGKIEKRSLALQNELRYPVSIGNFEFSPSAQLNLAAYQTKLSEKQAAYSLYSPRNETYSAEAGFGAYISTQKTFSKTQKLHFSAGALFYHEFLNPDELTLRMRGMNSSFKLTDEKRRDDYIVLRSQFSYDFGRISLWSSFVSYIDSEYRTRADIGLKYAF